MHSKPIHLLMRIRVADRHRLAAHQQVIDSYGSVMLGKFGRPLSAELLASLTGQLLRKIKTFLFLATREGPTGPYVIYCCRLRAVSEELPPGKRNLVPNYYEATPIGTWFEITSIAQMTGEEMKKLFVASTGRELERVLRSSVVVCSVEIRP
jgi:hypothetical protein